VARTPIRRRNARQALLLSLLVAAGDPAAHCAEPAPAPPPGPAAIIPLHPPSESALSRMKSLGGDRYQIGTILIEQRARRITLHGHVAHLGEAPLEYLAVTTHGLKAYESLLEVEASGSEFNLALILIGFDSDLSSRPGFQFDRRYPEGQLADIALRWKADGRERRASADEALLGDEQRARTPPSDWVYTGSIPIKNPTQVYTADATGTLVGFVHDPSDVIEHRLGLGIGQYGSVRGNGALLPPVGSAVELIVTRTGKLSEAASH
jgi:hypothetical protein